MNNEAKAADDESRLYEEANALAAKVLDEHKGRHQAGMKAWHAKYGDKK